MSSKKIIYQVLPRLWGEGKFSSIDDASLEYFRSLGVSDVWFTGVIRHATTFGAPGCPASDKHIVKGDLGSPYAIVDYYDVNPYLADDPTERMSEFESLLSRTHSHGLKVLIDFVPNHVSRDYGKVGLHCSETEPLGAADDPTVHWRPENDFYYYPGQPLTLPFSEQTYYENPAKASGNCFSPAPGMNDWYETVRLNYCDFHTATWDKMLEIVRYWCGKGVDGFRCDMVEMVPKEFFKWLISRIKEEFPGVVFIAEVYQKELYSSYIREVGFDLLYDKSGFYDSVRRVVEGKGSAKELTWNWQFLGDLQPRMLNFLENHDEQRFASDFFAGNAARTFAALGAGIFLNTAPYMVYFGEEIGERGMDAEGFSGLDGRTTIFDRWKVASIGRLCEYVHVGSGLSDGESCLIAKWRGFLNMAASLPEVASGRTFDLCYCNYGSPGFDPDRHFAFLRGGDGKAVLFVCNFAGEAARITVRIPREAFDYLSLPSQADSSFTVEVPGDDCVSVEIR